MISCELWVSLFHGEKWRSHSTDQEKRLRKARQTSIQRVKANKRYLMNKIPLMWEGKIMGRLGLNVFSYEYIWKYIPRFSSVSVFHDLGFFFFFLKLNIFLGYTLHKISLLLWRSLVLTNLYCLIESFCYYTSVWLLYLCISTLTINTCLQASQNDEFEGSWRNRAEKTHIVRVRNIN